MGSFSKQAAVAAMVLAISLGFMAGEAKARNGGGHWGGGGGHWGGGHWGGGGHWRGGHGWGWGAVGLGIGTGLALGAAPYYGAYGYGPYAGGECYIQRRWVYNAYGNRVLRRFRICY